MAVLNSYQTKFLLDFRFTVPLYRSSDLVRVNNITYLPGLSNESSIVKQTEQISFGESITVEIDDPEHVFPALMAAGEEFRGKGVKLTRYEPGDSPQTSFEFYGKITEHNCLDKASFTITIQDPDPLQTPLPQKLYETTDWAESAPEIIDPAPDLGKPYAIPIGYCPKVPMLHIHSDQTNGYYDYACLGPVQSCAAVYADKVVVAAVDYTFYNGSQASPYPGYAFLRFTSPQVNYDGSPMEICADINGMLMGGATAQRNYARAIQNLLNNAIWGLNEPVNATSFNTAAAALDTIGSLYCDMCLSSQRVAQDILNDLLYVARADIEKNESGEWTILVDTHQASTSLNIGDYASGRDNIRAIVSYGKTPSREATRTLALQYAWNNWEGTYLYKTSPRVVNAAIGENRTKPFSCIRDHTTADKTACYRQNLEVYGDTKLVLRVDMSARQLAKYQTVDVSISRLSISGTFQVRKIERGLTEFTLHLISYNSLIHTYVAGTLPNDANSDAAVPILDLTEYLQHGEAAYNGTVLYRTTGAPTNNPAPSGCTLTIKTNGTMDIRLDWGQYTQGANQADLLVLLWKKGTATGLGAPTLNDSALYFKVNTAAGSYFILEGVNPSDYWSFGIAAARRTENGLEISAIQSPTSAPDWQDVGGQQPVITGGNLTNNPAIRNLVRDGDFELGDLSREWLSDAVQGGGVPALETNICTGKYGCRIEGNGQAIRMFQRGNAYITVKPGETYWCGSKHGSTGNGIGTTGVMLEWSDKDKTARDYTHVSSNTAGAYALTSQYQAITVPATVAGGYVPAFMRIAVTMEADMTVGEHGYWDEIILYQQTSSNFLTGDVNSDIAEGVVAYGGTILYRSTGSPTNAPAPSGLTLTVKTNGTMDIRLDWGQYTQGANQADMLILFWKKGTAPLGTPTINDSAICFKVNTAAGSYFIFEGVNPSDNWSFGIATARRTDNGLEISAIQSPTSAPDWQDVTSGTPNYTANINGSAAATVVSNAANGLAAYNGTALYRSTGAPTNNPAPSGLTLTTKTNGTMDIRLDWGQYTQGAKQADMLILFWKKGTAALGAPTINDSAVCFNVNTTAGSFFIFEGANPADNWSFGIAAARRTDNGLEISTIQSPTSAPDWQDVTSGTPNYTANINGSTAATVVANAANGLSAYNGTVLYRSTGSPTNNPAPSGCTLTVKTNGTMDIRLDWGQYTQGANQADLLILLWKKGTATGLGAPTLNDSALYFKVNTAAGSYFIFEGVNPSDYWSFGIAAARRTENGLEISTIQTPSSAPNWRDVGGQQPVIGGGNLTNNPAIRNLVRDGDFELGDLSREWLSDAVQGGGVPALETNVCTGKYGCRIQGNGQSIRMFQRGGNAYIPVNQGEVYYFGSKHGSTGNGIGTTGVMLEWSDKNKTARDYTHASSNTTGAYALTSQYQAIAVPATVAGGYVPEFIRIALTMETDMTAGEHGYWDEIVLYQQTDSPLIVGNAVSEIAQTTIGVTPLSATPPGALFATLSIVCNQGDNIEVLGTSVQYAVSDASGYARHALQIYDVLTSSYVDVAEMYMQFGAAGRIGMTTLTTTYLKTNVAAGTHTFRLYGLLEYGTSGGTLQAKFRLLRTRR